MKRFFAAVLCTGLLAVSFAGCGYKDALTTQRASEATQDQVEETTVPKPEATEFDDSFDGLCSYFAELGYIAVSDGKIDTSKEVTMDSSLVGAKDGKKYKNTYNGKQITIELYSFDTDNLNDTAKGVIESVEKDGTFTILGLEPVTAYLSDNGKYMLIYTDNSIDKEKPDTEANNYKHREEVIADFQAFYK